MTSALMTQAMTQAMTHTHTEREEMFATSGIAARPIIVCCATQCCVCVCVCVCVYCVVVVCVSHFVNALSFC